MGTGTATGLAKSPQTTPEPSSPEQRASFPYTPQPLLAAVFLAAALLIAIGTGLWYVIEKTSPGYTGGGAAAAVGILLVVALIFAFPTLIMDDTAAAGGNPQP